jgi:hypothetical protein
MTYPARPLAQAGKPAPGAAPVAPCSTVDAPPFGRGLRAAVPLREPLWGVVERRCRAGERLRRFVGASGFAAGSGCAACGGRGLVCVWRALLRAWCWRPSRGWRAWALCVLRPMPSPSIGRWLGVRAWRVCCVACRRGVVALPKKQTPPKGVGFWLLQWQCQQT